MKIKDAKQLLKGFQKAETDRLTVQDTWQDLLYFVMPRKRGVQDKIEDGDKLPYDIFDDTAIQSNLVLAAGLSGYMTNSAQRWFELGTRDTDLMDSPDVREFLGKAQDIMFAALANSNFYQQVHECYLDLGAMGTANLYEEEDPIDDIRFSARHPKEIYCIENERGIIDMVYRLFEMTAYQATQEFGEDKVSEKINHAMENMDHGKVFEFIQYVCPRPVRDVSRDDNLNMPFASYWVERRAVKMVKESGYAEFPFFITRFYKNSDEVYGYSPTHVAYADIKSLNKMLEIYTKGAELAVYPPWLMENDSVVGTLDLRAGALNYQKQPMRLGQALQPLTSGMNLQITIDYINRTEKNIKDYYFSDLFLMLTNNNNMTATEVIQRTQEKMIMLSPVLGRLQNELLNPIIYRTFNILLRKGKLPPVPEVLLEADLDIVYVSPLAKAQRAVQAQDMQTYLTIIGNMVQIFPDIIDNIDSDEVADKFGKIYSIDPEIVRDPEARDGLREQRAEQQQQMAKLQMAQAAIEGAKTMSETKRNEADASTSNNQ